MLEARMKKSRQSKTTLDVDENESEVAEEQTKSEKPAAPG
jgi:hypothetical protein